MVRKKFSVLLLFLFASHCTSQECPTTPARCTCLVGGETIPIPDPEEGSRTAGIAGAVGALSSLLAAGSGFAIWKCIQNRRKRDHLGDIYQRSQRNSYDSTWNDRTSGSNPTTVDVKPYGHEYPDRFDPGRRRSSVGTTTSQLTNIYRAGRVWTGRVNR